MAVVGIDFGSLASKIGVARHRGIDIITNEVSSRTTPSLVSFGPRERHIGESAKTQEVSNFKNTVGSLKRMLGRSANDPEIADWEKKFITAQIVDLQGQLGVKVNFLGEPREFTYTQVVGMYLGALRDIAARELKIGVSDVVISVPGWFTDNQRRALIDAAQIAGLNPLRLINDSTAIALGWGITKSDLPEPENPRHVVFVDIGHANYSVAVVAFAKGQLTVKSTAFERHLGGRDFDYALVQHFAAEFKSKYKIDVLSNPKATFRLSAACEKLKKVLSANLEAPLNVESIMNDVDVSSKLNREQFESLVSEPLSRITEPLQRALQEAGLTSDQIDAIELVGGSTRIPAIRERILVAFPGKTLSTTLNQDEAVARGATFACAMLSPTFRVRDFSMHDIAPFPIKVHWEKSAGDPDDDTELVVFPRGNSVPSTKVLSFYRAGPFDVDATYADPANLPIRSSPFIARFSAKNVGPDAKGDLSCVKIKTRLNTHGIVSFEDAYVEEIEEREVEDKAMDVDQPEGTPAPPKKKKVVKKKPVEFVVHTNALDSTTLASLKEQEAEMHASDKLVRDTADRKNALEEYVYDMRSKLDDKYASFVQAAEKSKLQAALNEAEEWLYTEEGEDATKSAYVDRLDALKKLGDPIASRYRENDERSRAMAQLRETLDQYISHATSTEERYAHIDEKDKQTIVEKAATIQKWLGDMVAKQAERPKNVDPIVTVEQIGKKRDELIYFATPILSRPKPKPKVETAAPTPRNETPDPAAQQPQGEAPPPPQGPSEMDVD
ncbi:heat shock protein 70 [Exidia glandulosa HHB12029]|uniref:Heat shock protein 70 n=1 Tax=Exidia glandulosa HHB12029 TaxID=1314781 RepID=A0A165GQM4_EXIGL|nr:heat shock protein 70 [Exidia glandulosa HHB12029]